MDMAQPCFLSENLREASCLGDEQSVLKLISKGAHVNSQNKMNGWTALHWAAARNHKRIVEILLENGGDPNITNKKGERPGNVTTNDEIRTILGELSSGRQNIPELAIIPSYLLYPTLPVCMNFQDNYMNDFHMKNDSVNSGDISNIIILKVRLANNQDPDFIEIELEQGKMNIKNFIKVCCEELKIKENDIKKIRKLPNTVIRKDKDIERLTNYQEIEIVCDVT